MRRMLKTLEKKYDYPVDIEFTVNFTNDSAFQINLVQCRPLQTKGEGKRVSIPKHIPKDHMLFQSKGNFMGSNIMQPIQRIIFVDPEAYSALSLTEKYDIARLIGKLNRLTGNREEQPDATHRSRQMGHNDTFSRCTCPVFRNQQHCCYSGTCSHDGQFDA